MDGLFSFVVFLVIISLIGLKKPRNNPAEGSSPSEEPSFEELLKDIQTRMQERQAQRDETPVSVPQAPQRPKASTPVVSPIPSAPARDVSAQLQRAQARLEASKQSLRAAQERVRSSWGQPRVVEAPRLEEVSVQTLLKSSAGQRAAFVSSEVFGPPRALREI
jgi:hypothetical protein